MPSSSLHEQAVGWLAEHGEDLVDWRRQLHSNPEVAYSEHRTTELIDRVLTGFGLSSTRLSIGTGLMADIGPGPEYIALRADIDALPLHDHKTVSYASRNPGVCHACGHDAHTAILLGVAGCLAAAHRAGLLTGSVRLIFQPAEERMPGGAEVAVNEGALRGVSAIFALHCDPKLDVGQLGLRVGPITASFNQLEIQVSGPGGHTARPHLSVDVVYALGKLITELPGLLSRRIDPRAAVSLVWGAVNAGSAPNAIPTTGQVSGTLRMLDSLYWDRLSSMVSELAEQVIAPTGAQVKINYDPGVPAVVNDAIMVAVQTRAAIAAFGLESVADTPQSMGGEDFAWYLQTVPGALARLGVRRSGDSGPHDLHTADFDIDESALGIGVRFSVALLDELWATVEDD